MVEIMIQTKQTEAPDSPGTISDNLPIHRPDGELMGFLKPAGQRWIPCTVFGFPLSEPFTKAAATDYVLAEGLSCLADRWELRDDNDWLNVTIIEASPTSVIISFADYGRPELFGKRHTLKAPGDSLLRRG